MKDIYATTVIREQTSVEKKEINLIFPRDVVHYIVNGKGIFNGNELCSGQAFICKKGKLCRYKPDEQMPWEYIYFKVQGRDVDEFLNQYEMNHYIFSYDSPEKLGLLVDQLCNDDDKLFDQEYGKALYYVVSSMHDDYRTSLHPAKENRYVKMAKEYMELNFCNHLTVDEVAEYVHVSRAYLRNIFVESEGISTKQYLTGLRMQHADLLLKQTGQSITEIAQAVGYGDVFQFIKAFRKHFNMAPSRYRKLYRI